MEGGRYGGQGWGPRRGEDGEGWLEAVPHVSLEAQAPTPRHSGTLRRWLRGFSIC